MPQEWKEAVPWEGREDSDQAKGDCCLTVEDFVQNAHIIAKTEWGWWVENNMNAHSATSGSTRDTPTIGTEMTVPGNLLTLSDNLHRLWDSEFFCLFPLKTPSDEWRLHCIFTKSKRKVARKHHRRPLRGGLSEVSPACAWSSFVYSICRVYEETFLTKLVERRLGGSVPPSQWVNGSEALQIRQGRANNTSPTKKSRSGSQRKRHRSHSENDESYQGLSKASSSTDSAIELDQADNIPRGRLRSRKEDRKRAAMLTTSDLCKKRRLG